jgi:hypothetical protein
VTTTPDTDRQARRDALLHLTRRMLRGALLPPERDLLATHVEEALRDGDQAREQLATAERDHNTRRVDLTQALGQRMDLEWPWLLAAVREQREARSGTRTASDVLVEHDVTRKALCDALDAGYHLNWQQLVDTAQRHHDANAEWQAEAEQHRKALAEALDVHPSRDWANLINTAEDVRRDRRAAGLRAHEAEQEAARARRGEAEAVRARKAAEDRARKAERAVNLLAGSHRRAEKAEAEVARLTGLVSQYADRGIANGQRAEKAEATLTAVREAVAGRRAEVADYEAERPPSAWSDAVAVTCDRVEEAIAVAALGDPQPTTEQRCVCGDPIERWTGPGWIHTPGSDTPCLDARPAADDVTRLSQETDAEQDGLYHRLCRILGLPAETTDDDLIEVVRGLLVREARKQPAEPQQPAPALSVVTCGPITTHAAHQYMTGRTVYQCPGLTVTDLREQAAEPLLSGTPLVISLNLDPAEISDIIRRIVRRGGAG